MQVMISGTMFRGSPTLTDIECRNGGKCDIESPNLYSFDASGQVVAMTATHSHTQVAVADTGAEVVSSLSPSVAALLPPPFPSPDYIYA